MPYLFYKMGDNIRDKETGQEPEGAVAPGEASGQEVVVLEGLLRSREFTGEEQHKGQAYTGTDGSPREIGYHQSVEFVPAIRARVTLYPLVEISRFEEKETHQVEAPLHNRLPPVGLPQGSLTDNMQSYHP